jgi:mannosyltransferase
MSSGCAVLASRAGAWPDIIEPGVHGELVNCGDLAATSDALNKLLSSPEKLNTMGAAGRQHVLAHYKIEQEADSLCTLYKRLIAVPSR